MGRVTTFLSSQGIPLAQEQKRQVLTLDREFEDMEAQIQTLQTENLHLKAQVKPLEREVERLKEQIQQSQLHEDHLDDKAIELLKAVAAQRDHRFSERLAIFLCGDVAKANFYLGLLRKRGFISQSAYAPEIAYRVLQPGLEYLHQHGNL